MTAGLERFLAVALAARGRPSWSTDPIVASSAGPGRAVIEGRERLLLCTNDYLGLAADPRVVEAAHEASSRYGAGSRAARSLAGDTDVHRELERELAEFKGTEAALLFGSGFACNVGVIAALTAAEDVIFSDALNHASIVDGARSRRPRPFASTATSTSTALDALLAEVRRGGEADDRHRRRLQHGRDRRAAAGAPRARRSDTTRSSCSTTRTPRACSARPAEGRSSTSASRAACPS